MSKTDSFGLPESACSKYLGSLFVPRVILYVSLDLRVHEIPQLCNIFVNNIYLCPNSDSEELLRHSSGLH